MARKIKVYRTPISFHDAYVAAPSQKAALKAWGSDADLFARGVAELVTDETLSATPLEHPGEIIRLRRGSDAQNIAALSKAAKRSATRKTAPIHENDTPSPRPRRRATARKDAAATEAGQPAPRRSLARSQAGAPAELPRQARSKRPSRARLDKAEAALAEADTKHRSTIEALRAQEQELQRQRRDLEQRHDTETKRLEDRITKAYDAYSESLRAWRG